MSTELPINTTSSAKLPLKSQHKKIGNIESFTPGSWLLVEYEQEFFLGIVLEVSKLGSNVHVPCLEKPYGVSDPPDLEKERISVRYDVTQMYEVLVKPQMIQVRRGWKYTYLLKSKTCLRDFVDSFKLLFPTDSMINFH